MSKPFSVFLAITLYSCFIGNVCLAQDLSDLYKKVNPAVVEIYTEEKELVSTGGISKQVSAQGLGSGFMVSDTTLITAAHVVQVADRLLVSFVDGEKIPARVISSFKNQDVALVQLSWSRKKATTLRLGDSDKMEVGDRVFIVGAPYGLGHSLSSGYVSGFANNSESNPFTSNSFIQTDAAINQGNSGGPMFNLKGEVVGIVSNIVTTSSGFQGIGFAAASNLTKELLFIKRVLWTGTDLYPLHGKMARWLNLPQPSGLLVQRVVLLSPMGLMGLQGGDTEIIVGSEKLIVGGDVILGFNDIKFDLDRRSLDKIADLAQAIGPEDPLQLKVLRGGKVITLERE